MLKLWLRVDIEGLPPRTAARIRVGERSNERLEEAIRAYGTHLWVAVRPGLALCHEEWLGSGHEHLDGAETERPHRLRKPVSQIDAQDLSFLRPEPRCVLEPQSLELVWSQTIVRRHSLEPVMKGVNPRATGPVDHSLV
jgi:hypothetical protein